MQEYDAALRAVPYFEPASGVGTESRQCCGSREGVVPRSADAGATRARSQPKSTRPGQGGPRADAEASARRSAGRLCGKKTTRAGASESGAAGPASAGIGRSMRAGHTLSHNGSSRAAGGSANSRGGATGGVTDTAGEQARHPKDFARLVLRIVLEVLDRRRPAAQLAPFAAPPVLAVLRTLVTGDHAPGRRLGPAVLSRVHVIAIDEHTAEVCASYQRGKRCFALAARITRNRSSDWRLTALRVG